MISNQFLIGIAQAVVTLYNFQQYRHIQSPGWQLKWTWAKKEVIWSMVGGQTTEQGDCSKFKGNTPHCCKKDPTVVDLLPGTPYNQQIANCCKGGVISSWAQDPPNSDRVPVTWNVTCTYSQFLSQKTPTCCVSLSSFYNETIVPCPTCTCGCQNNITKPGSCVEPDSPHLASVVSGSTKNSYTPLVQCTNHMCPIRIHWHVKINYKEYWRVKVTITNFNYRMNYSQWNLVVQHPNFDNLTQLFSFNYKSLTPYGAISKMTLLCYGELSSTMIYSCKLALLVMCNQSYFFKRTKQLSLLTRAGLSPVGSILMVIIVLCHLLMNIRGCQMLVLIHSSHCLLKSFVFSFAIAMCQCIELNVHEKRHDFRNLN